MSLPLYTRIKGEINRYARLESCQVSQYCH